MVKYDFTAFTSTTISSNKLQNINSFIDSLMDVFLRIQNLTVFFIDTMEILPSISQKIYNNKKINYCSSNFNEVLSAIGVTSLIYFIIS